ncbi:coagulation factor VIII [Anguilla rostrata]|uniref:coagulation factor VIII n=1 Tax=Anguilla rostrata TaxID=7938 RepID=UPI0030CBDB43
MKTLLPLFISVSICMMRTKADTREFYIAAVEQGWDYRHQENLDAPLVQRKRILPSKNGVEQYMKAVYWEYKDSTFSTPKAKPPWMGIQGPTIKAEVNDRVLVHFKNFASLPFSIFPVGISYWKQSEGAGYDDATSNQEKEDDAVPPGGYYRYVWDIQPADGPTLMDPDCLTYSYTSQVDIIRDFNSGLIGTLLICKAGSLKRASQQEVPEFILLFAIFDETKSWYGEGGMARERVIKTRAKKQYHTINGYANSTLQGLKMCRRNNVIWHLIGMGSSPEIHSIQFQDHTLQVKNHRKVSLEVTPMTLATAEMKPTAVGKFLISCQIHSHQKAGMTAFFTVEDCPEPSDSLNKKYVVSPDDYTDYDMEDAVNAIMVNPMPMVRSVKMRPKVWRHYIAVEEITWDYAPDLGEKDRTLASEYLEQGPQRIGKKYKKAIYVEYSDDRFTHRKAVEGGLMGPVLRGEVGDQIEIVLKNWASRPFNIYPNDLTSVHASGGKDLLKGKSLRDFAVQPNETFVYLWKITSEDGPTAADPKCLTRLYQSTVDPVRDVASGLIGPLVVCYRKTLDKRGNVLMSDKEKHLMFTVFDENKSWYINENIRKYIKDPSTVNHNDPGFYNSNVMHNVNGYMYNNLRFKACLDDVIFWHVVNVGTDSKFLSIYFTGNIFERDKVHQTVLTLFPMAGETISMEMETVGAWEISALDSSLKNRGMSAQYSVHYCDQKLPLVDYEEYYDFLDDDSWENNIARSSSGRNRTLTVRVCKRPVTNNTLAATANTTVHNLKPVCVIKHIAVKQNTTAFSKGDIPDDVLQELDREIKRSSAERHQRSPTTSLPVNDTGKHSDSQSDLAGSILNNTLPSDSRESLEENCGTACHRRVRKRAADVLMVGPVTPDLHTTPQMVPAELEEKEEANVSLPTPHVTLPSLTDVDNKQVNESKELGIAESMFEKEQEENATVDDLENISHELGSSSTTVPSHSQGSTLKSLMSTLNSKLHGSSESDRLLRRNAKEDGKGEDKKSSEQQEDQVLKDNSDLEQGNFSQFGKEQGSVNQTDSGYKALDRQSLDLQILDPQVNGSESSNSTRRGLSLEYDDYSQETNSSRMDFDFEEDLNMRASDGKYRNYYIAAEEVMWDYGLKKPQQLIKPREMRMGMRKYFPEYKKAVFRAYTDKDFLRPATRGELEEHLGIMGPVIQAEINDLVIVTFKNLASRPYSFHLHGVYDKSQGPANGEAVQPNEVRVFKWKITRRQGPSPKEFDCKAGAYYSNLNMEKDIHSGLIGPLIVCKPGTLHPFTDLQPGVQQFSLLFTVFDETKSWYLEDNIQRFCRSPCTIRNEDPWFKLSNRFAAINGYVAETLPGLLVAQHHPVRWHLLNMGAGGEFHSVHFHGLPFTVRSDQEHRMGIYNLYPGVFGTVEMRPAMVGTWMVECTIGEHQLSGMRAKLLVYSSKCVEPLGMRTGRILDTQITDSGHYGNWESRLARLGLSGSINAWSAVNKKSWIQVDLMRPMVLHGVHTQGASHGLSESFVVQFTLSYSLDQETWKTYKGNSTKPEMVFIGNVDGSSVKENYFSPPIMGRYIRLNPETFQNRATLRLELFGCDLNSCSTPMGMEKMRIPNQSISASSFLQTWFLTWSPSLARLNLDGNANAWRPKTNNPHEWIQVDFGEVKRLTGVITQGARSMLKHMMVTEFTVSISNDGRVWSSLLEENSSKEKVFLGNNEHDEEILNLFEPPVFARYIRIQPKGWYNEIALRLEFLGCNTQQRL